jgi:hypothetical protein
MRNELNETRLIDAYLFGQLDEEDRRHFDARLLCNEVFAGKVDRQRTAHRLIRLFARTLQRRRLEAIHRKLSTEPEFARQLQQIFA